MMKEYCGVDCAAVIYPPVATEFPTVSRNDKEQSFAMVGQIAPEKRIERAILVLKAVRARVLNQAAFARAYRKRSSWANDCAALPTASRLDCC